MHFKNKCSPNTWVMCFMVSWLLISDEESSMETQELLLHAASVEGD